MNHVLTKMMIALANDDRNDNNDNISDNNDNDNNNDDDNSDNDKLRNFNDKVLNNLIIVSKIKKKFKSILKR